MTQRLAEIAARAEAATPGPWELVPALDGDGVHFKAGVDDSEGNAVIWVTELGDEGCDREEDAAFIAASRQDIPYLLSALTAAAARIAGLEAAVQCAANILDYVSGDAWERECTEKDRLKFDDLMAELFPDPNPPQSGPQYRIHVSTAHSPRKPCPLCGRRVRGAEGIAAHMEAKHPEIALAALDPKP